MSDSLTQQPPPAGGTTPATLDGLSRLVRAAAGDFTADDLLRDLCGLAGAALDADGAGVMRAQGDRVEYVHADPAVVCLERLQEDLQRGPCCDSLDDRAPLVVTDLAHAQRWPEFVDESLRAGVRSMVAVPLQTGERSWGVLDLYRSTPRSWTDDDLVVATVFADLVASFLAVASER